MAQKISVIGAGLMGNGITQAMTMAGKDVVMYDISAEALNKGMAMIDKSLSRFVKAGHITEEQRQQALRNIDTSLELESALQGAELVIEAVPENLSLKKDLFEKLDEMVAPETVLASNTSELSITAIAAATRRPERVIGMHWFNPAPVMKLVEIVEGVDTSAETVKFIEQVAREAGKETVVVKDRQGFVTSRALAAHLLECMRIYEEGIASREDIDKAIMLGLNYPMGPLQLADYVGLDTLLFASEGMVDAYGDRFRPPQILRKLVEAGHYGVKSGRGFYDYNKE